MVKLEGLQVQIGSMRERHKVKSLRRVRADNQCDDLYAPGYLGHTSQIFFLAEW